MISFMHFDRPGWLLLAVIIIPVIAISWRGMQKRAAHGRVIAATLTRCLVLLLLSVAIARPVWNRTGYGLTLVALLDRSQSIPRVLQDQTIEVLANWTSPQRRNEGDRLSVISIGDNAVIGSMP
ncbi:MAG: hypothetical protein QGF07_02195, partial [Phycisphaerales bacterium]|nr:hypothetical protein [Phycisphaerales bacterium]